MYMERGICAQDGLKKDSRDAENFCQTHFAQKAEAVYTRGLKLARVWGPDSPLPKG